MKLYHGTTSTVARAAMKEGLKPRSFTGSSNWDHTVQSNSEAVYLTNSYPLYFAIAASDATKRNPFPAIIEIDTDLIDTNLLHPDEDVLAQIGRNCDDLPKDWDLNKRSEYYRDVIFDNPNWELSLKIMGTCCYEGIIPASAITRYAIVNPKKNPSLCWTAMDASISVMNYKFMSEKYSTLTNWIFNNPIDFSDESKYENLPDEFRRTFTNQGIVENFDKEGRDGIRIVTHRSL